MDVFGTRCIFTLDFSSVGWTTKATEYVNSLKAKLHEKESSIKLVIAEPRNAIVSFFPGGGQFFSTRKAR